jgi:hypothetical protein
MKLASLVFLSLLFVAHAAGDPERLLGQPLSELRDGEQGWLGYTLFAALLVVGVLYIGALVRSRRAGEAAVAGLAVLLLVVVTVTPSWGASHLLSSLVLLLLLHVYYGLLLYRAESFWLLVHLLMPVALAGATGFHSYGMWQKSFIAYCVVTAAVHEHLVVRQAGRRACLGVGTRRASQPMRKRKVYRLEVGREWQRSSPGAGAAG